MKQPGNPTKRPIPDTGTLVAGSLLIGSLMLAAFSGSLAMSGNASATSTDTITMDDMAETDRYQLKREGDKFIRMDRKTGKMSVCILDGENLICRMAADERDALQQEMDDLQTRLDDLERKMTRRNYDAYSDGYLDEEEFEAALDKSARVLRRFFDVMKDLRHEFEN